MEVDGSDESMVHLLRKRRRNGRAKWRYGVVRVGPTPMEERPTQEPRIESRDESVHHSGPG